MAIVSGQPIAISTRATYLGWRPIGSSDPYTQYLDITSFGDLMGAPDLIDVTTLSHARVVQILGLLSGDAIGFEYNYTAEHYARALANKSRPLEFALFFQDGSGFVWTGEYNIPVNGGGTNESMGSIISVSVTSDMDWFAGDTVNPATLAMAQANDNVTIVAAPDFIPYVA